MDENKPPIVNKTPLAYQSAAAGEGRHLNRWWKVMLRMLAGTGAGVAACIGGVLIANATNMPIVGLIPPLTVFGAALFVSIKYRRFGYTAGVIIAPFLIVSVLFVLLLIVCGGMLKGGT